MEPSEWDKLVASKDQYSWWSDPRVSPGDPDDPEVFLEKLIQLGNERDMKARFYDIMEEANMVVVLPYKLPSGIECKCVVLDPGEIIKWKEAYDLMCESELK